jgi:flagellar FliJ protein
VEESLSSPIEARFVQFVPYYLNAKRQNIKILQTQLKVLQEKRDDLVYKLAQKKAEIKVIESLRDKKKSEHIKKIDKKKNQEIEELFQARKHYKDAI